MDPGSDIRDYLEYQIAVDRHAGKPMVLLSDGEDGDAGAVEVARCASSPKKSGFGSWNECG